MRRFVVSAVLVACTFAFAYSDTFNVVITGVDGNQITWQKSKKGVVEGDKTKSTVAKDVVVEKGGKKGTDPTPIEGGVKGLAELVTKAGDKGVNASITTSEDGGKGNITKITTKGGKGKGA